MARSCVCLPCQVTDGMIMAASEALAASNRPEDLAKGRVYPGLSDVRGISVRYESNSNRARVYHCIRRYL